MRKGRGKGSIISTGNFLSLRLHSRITEGARANATASLRGESLAPEENVKMRTMPQVAQPHLWKCVPDSKVVKERGKLEVPGITRVLHGEHGIGSGNGRYLATEGHMSRKRPEGELNVLPCRGVNTLVELEGRVHY